MNKNKYYFIGDTVFSFQINDDHIISYHSLHTYTMNYPIIEGQKYIKKSDANDTINPNWIYGHDYYEKNYIQKHNERIYYPFDNIKEYF